MKHIKPVERKPHDSIHPKINMNAVNIDSIEALNKQTDKMVKGTFVNIECPGQTAKVCGKFYKEMPYFSKVFQDNEKATIPLSVARFINERCYHETHGYILDTNGEHIKNPKPQFRYKFIIEEYVAA